MNKYLKFYEIMNYPVPKNSELYFQYNWKNNEIIKIKEENFSRSEKSLYMDEYLQEIEKLKPILKSIPFIEHIYLCNSITFNSLNKESDIDLFIIATPWRIRTVKFWSMLLLTFKWAKRFWNNKRKKICLSFFITSDSSNLYNISLPSTDIYLAYWIAHLVLIYQSDKSNNSNIFLQNKRVKWILPNFQEKQTISLWINPMYWKSKFKIMYEKIWQSIIWDILEIALKFAQKIIILIKISINKEQNKDVIISDQMLKFHKDIREKISLEYKIATKE